MQILTNVWMDPPKTPTSPTAEYAFEGVSIVELPGNELLLADLLAGQKAALETFGIHGVISSADAVATPGSFAVVARSASGELIGGMRIHIRTPNKCLPIESERSPLPRTFRQRIAGRPNICEAGGLWVKREAAGRSLSQRIVATGTLAAYERGFSAVVALMHEASFRFVTEPMGYWRDSDMPIVPYPDERYQTFVVLHRCGQRLDA